MMFNFVKPGNHQARHTHAQQALCSLYGVQAVTLSGEENFVPLCIHTLRNIWVS